MNRTGDRIVVVVQKQRATTSEGASSTALANKVRRGDIRHAVVVRARKELQREDGTIVRFGDNACVLVNKAGDPIGTRMNGGLLNPRISVSQALITSSRCRWSRIKGKAVVQDSILGSCECVGILHSWESVSFKAYFVSIRISFHFSKRPITGCFIKPSSKSPNSSERTKIILTNLKERTGRGIEKSRAVSYR